MVSDSFHGHNMPSAKGPRSVTVVPMVTYSHHDAQETGYYDDMDDWIEQGDACGKELDVCKVSSKHMYPQQQQKRQPTCCLQGAGAGT